MYLGERAVFIHLWPDGSKGSQKLALFVEALPTPSSSPEEVKVGKERGGLPGVPG